MANQRYTLTSYDPIYVVAEEVRIPEEAVRKTALRWLELNVCKDGETPKLNDQWIAKHVEDLNTVEELLIFIRYNMYKDNVEVQQLADQNVICRELATRLVEDLPEDLVEEALYASAYRLEEMLRMNGLQKKDYCEQRGISEEQLDAEGRGTPSKASRRTRRSPPGQTMRITLSRPRISTRSSRAIRSRTRRTSVARSSSRAECLRWRNTRSRQRPCVTSWKMP